MGFWDSLKAGFLGAAGVDYYSMKSSETLREIRDSLGAAPLSGQGIGWSRRALRASTLADTHETLAHSYQSILTEAHAAIEELQEALADTNAAAFKWASRIELAFIDLNEVLVKLESLLPEEPPEDAAPSTALAFRRLRRCILGFRRAASLWLEKEYAASAGMVN